jgi:uncharacterized membrane protein
MADPVDSANSSSAQTDLLWRARAARLVHETAGRERSAFAGNGELLDPTSTPGARAQRRRVDGEAVFDLHAAGAIGTFDSAVIRKEADGKVRVTKTEKPTQHGAWTGAAVGALVGIIFPPAVIGSAIVGAGAGGLTGHLSRGISRGDLKDLGEELEADSAAVIVLGESKIEEQLEQATKRANKLIEKQVDADADEFKRDIEEAEKESAAT